MNILIQEDINMVAQLAQKTYTIGEYLDTEEEAEIRHEFIKGKMIPMTGGTTNHNLITGNVYLALRLALKWKKTPVYIENVRLFIPDYNIFTYPDVMVMAGEPIYYNDRQTTVTNPVILIEVLSNSTKDYDLGRKFGYYRSLDTLQEYILIEPEQATIMVYRRSNDKNWLLEIIENTTDILRLDSVAIELSVSEIYEGVLA